ncbi:MAG: hypothetical protein ACKO8O_21755 [Betaproteobacteria bacterium]
MRRQRATKSWRKANYLADKKIGENASWEVELLGIELSELKDAGFDLGLTGFSTEAWEALITGEEQTQRGPTRPVGARMLF